MQCSRWKPSYEFHSEGLLSFSPTVEGLVLIQDVNVRIYKLNTKLILNLCTIYMVHVSSTIWRIKNQPPDSTSCSDNALHLLVLVAGRLCWRLQVTSSFSIWGCVLEGSFVRGIFWRAKPHLTGIEDLEASIPGTYRGDTLIRGYLPPAPRLGQIADSECILTLAGLRHSHGARKEAGEDSEAAKVWRRRAAAPPRLLVLALHPPRLTFTTFFFKPALPRGVGVCVELSASSQPRRWTTSRGHWSLGRGVGA